MLKDLVDTLATLILKRAYETDRGDLVVSVADLRTHLGQFAVNQAIESSYEFNRAVNKEIIRRTRRVAA